MQIYILYVSGSLGNANAVYLCCFLIKYTLFLPFVATDYYKIWKKKLISLFLPYIIPPPNIDSSNLSFVRIYAQGVYKKVIKQGLSRSNNGNPVCVSGDKKYSFFGKFGVLCFVEALVLRFALLPYNRRYASILAFMQKTTIQL